MRHPRYYFASSLAVLAIGAALLLFTEPPALASRWLYALLVAYSIVACITFAVLASNIIREPFDVDSMMADTEPSETLVSYWVNPMVPPARKKHPQFILAMDQEYFDRAHHFRRNLNVLAIEDFLSWPETASALVLKERGALEPDEGYRQLLPYLLVRQTGKDGVRRFLAYQRASGGGESRLTGKVSVGFGGHIDATSVVFNALNSTINLRRTLVGSAARERDEELRLVDGFHGEFNWPTLQFSNLFIAHNEGVQRVHLGIVMHMDLPPDAPLLECAEPELLTLGMMTAESLLAGEASGYYELEVWTRLLLEAEVGVSTSAV